MEGPLPLNANQVQVDPDVGIPDLVRRLTDDSKRLVKDEVRLAKIETRESVKAGARGSLRLALSFGAGVVALTAFTVALAAGLGALLGNVWAGTLLTGVIELAVAGWLVKRGIGAFGEPSYTLAASRESLKDTAHWVAAPRGD